MALSGLTGGVPVATNVMPFILRGVSLIGIESVYYPQERRAALWQRMADDFASGKLLDLIESGFRSKRCPRPRTRSSPAACADASSSAPPERDHTPQNPRTTGAAQ